MIRNGSQQSADIRRICGSDPEGKIHLLMDYTGQPHDVADPWWTGDFETTWNDVEEGCIALLKWCQENTGIGKEAES